MASRPLVRARRGEAEPVRKPRGLPRAVDAGLVRRPEPPRRPLHIDPRLNGQFQTLGRWSGEVDEGTGFRNAGARLQISMPLGSVVVAPSIYRELWTHGSAGQTFRQRTTWAVALSRVY